MTDGNHTVIIDPAGRGTFGVYVPDLPGYVSSGEAVDDALARVREAIRSHIETLRALGKPVPPPRSRAKVVKA